LLNWHFVPSLLPHLYHAVEIDSEIGIPNLLIARSI